MRLKVILILSTILIIIAILGLAATVMTPQTHTAALPTVVATPSALTRLTDDYATDVRPVWSPDNRLIAFQSNRGGDKYHIYVTLAPNASAGVNADGGQLRALTNGTRDDRRPVWTPDGKFILFDSYDGTHEEIWSVNVADGTLKQLTHTDGLASFASLSPDGKRMAFYVYKNNSLDLWVARADGGDAHPVTKELATVANEQCTFACHQPAWSPDGQWLAYTGGDGKSIWMIQPDTAKTRCIIEDDETNHFPWFMPDGRLAYLTEYVPPRYGGAWSNAWAYDLKTGQRSLIQEFMALQGPVDWSTDGSKILFHSPRAGNFDSYLIDLKLPSGLAILQGTPVPDESQ